MRAKIAGRVLLGLGLAVGLAASAGLLLGFEPARLPDALLNIAAYKLTFLAGAGLLTAGAMLGRFSRNDEGQSEAAASALSGRPETHELPEGREGPALPAGRAASAALKSERSAVKRGERVDGT